LNLRELISTWKIDIKDEPLKRVEGHLAQVKTGLNFLIGSQMVSGMIAVSERFSKWAHELNSVSIASGVTVEAIQRLTFAGAKFGATQEDITGAMSNLTLKINDAKMGIQGAQQAFAMAGFSSEQVRGFKNGNDALLALADRMKATVDPIRRQAMAAQLGVSANSKLYAFLSQGSKAMREAGKEAEALGTVMSKGQVAALTGAQNAMSKLIMTVEGLGKNIASMLAPSLEQGVNDLLEFYKANKKVIEVNVKNWIDDFLYGLGYLYGILKVIAKAVLDFADAHPVLFKRITQVLAVVFALGAAMMAFGVVIAPVIMAFKSLAVVGGLVMIVVKAIGGALMFLVSPLSLTLVAVTALMLGLDALWQVFVNGRDWKDTWLGQLIMNVKDFIMDIPSKLGKVMSFLGLSSDETGDKASVVEGVSSNLGAAQRISENMGTAVTSASDSPFSTSNSVDNSQTSNNSQSSTGNYSVNAPITINVKSGTAKQMAKSAQEGIRDHLDRMRRETHRNLKTAEQY
jgi:hypothetical protein